MDPITAVKIESIIFNLIITLGCLVFVCTAIVILWQTRKGFVNDMKEMFKEMKKDLT